MLGFLRTAIAQRSVSGLWLLVLAAEPSVADWPQWRGPDRDGALSGFIRPDPWPERLSPRWSLEVGEGHSSPVVAGDRVFVFSRQGESEVLQSIDLGTGRSVWRQSYPAPYQLNSAARSHGKGPKSTPVLDGNRICTLGISGILSCFAADTGRTLWRREFGSVHRETSPLYGTAMSPVIDRGRLIAHVGGAGDGALTAFDVDTGGAAWSWRGDGPAYASPVVAELGGRRQVVTFSESSLVGIAADVGELLWRLPFTTPWVQNAITPIVVGGTVIYSGLDHPLAAVRVTRQGSGWRARPVWENDAVSGYMSTPVLRHGRLFGMSQRKRGQFFCLDVASGRTIWVSEGRQGDNAAIVAGDGDLFLLTNEAELIVAPLAGDVFAPSRRYTVADSPTWAHPVVLSQGILIKDATRLSLLSFSEPDP